MAIGDLRSVVETRSIADQINAIGRMDAVIHNAGVYTQQSRNSTPEGHASVLAINTLAPYMLTGLVERPRRLIYLSSGLHRSGEGSLADLDWTKRTWDPAKAYAESKLHAVALAFGLARRPPDVQSARPGISDRSPRGPAAPDEGDASSGRSPGRMDCRLRPARPASVVRPSMSTGAPGPPILVRS